jgi:DNA repair protein RadC
MPSIKLLNPDERPREKLIEHGAETLSPVELLAILIGTGSGKKTAIDLGRELLDLTHQNLAAFAKLSSDDLQQIKGIGQAKAVTILAAIQFALRIEQYRTQQVVKLNDINIMANFLKTNYGHYNHEVFAVIFLNNAFKLITHQIMSQGGLTSTMVDVRLILKKALALNATKLVVCHNHPSGNVQPSREDIAITQKIKEACKTVDIHLEDHIIVSADNHYSFANNDQM